MWVLLKHGFRLEVGLESGWELTRHLPEVLVWLPSVYAVFVLCAVRRGEKDKGGEKLRKVMGPKQIAPHAQGCRECIDLSPASAHSATGVAVQ